MTMVNMQEFHRRFATVAGIDWNRYFPKFIHYCGHAETLADFFDALGMHRVQRSLPASSFLIEFFSVNDQNQVRFKYLSSDSNQEETFRIPGFGDTISLEDLQIFLSGRLAMARFTDVPT